MLKWRILIVSLFLSFTAHADTVKRDVVALYFGSEYSEVTETPFHRYLELPLNYLGFHVRYWDVDKGLPSEEMMKDIFGILTWFQGKKFDDTNLYASWLIKQLRNNKKYVFFGVSNLVENAKGELTSINTVNQVMRLLGIHRQDAWVNKHEVKSYQYFSAFAEKFERQVEQEKTGFYAQRATHPQAQLWLRGRYNDGEISDLILTTPKGGCALEGHFLFFPDNTEGQESIYTYATQWQIDPIRFLREALGERGPIPDLTTCCGQRLAFVHIDGDGWNNFSEATRKNLISAEVVLENLLIPNNDICFTIGPIASDLDPAWGGTKKAQEVLRKIAYLPHIEIANHTYSHPQEWGFYKVKRELKEERAKKDPPRGNLKKPFDLKNEVEGAQKEIVKYLPPEKQIKLYLWSGDCLPFEAVFKELSSMNLLNLNGGSNRFDTEFPSITGISPFYRQVGPYVQVYSAGNNEESYTYGWSERFFGLKFFNQTLRNTEHPYRLKPMNLYFNMYTGQKYAALYAAKQVLDYMRSQEGFWCFAQDYAALVTDFPKVKIEKMTEYQWKILNRGHIHTFRFDLASDKSIDLVNSKGVMGFRHLQGNLYVALDPAVEHAEIHMKISDHVVTADNFERAYLFDSTWGISDFTSEPTIGFTAEGIGKAVIRLMLPQKDEYKVFRGEKQLGADQVSIKNNIVEIQFFSEKKVKEKIKVVGK